VVREMSTGQSAVMRYGWGSKALWLILWINVWAGKIVWSIVSTCHHERSRGAYTHGKALSNVLILIIPAPTVSLNGKTSNEQKDYSLL